jgi:Phenol hydroxylase subunit
MKIRERDEMNNALSVAADMRSSTWQTPRGMATVLKTGTPTILVRTFSGTFVEFEFALGDPMLALEMVMPTKEFQEFCRRESAIVQAPLEAILRLRATGEIDPDFAISLSPFSQEPI